MKNTLTPHFVTISCDTETPVSLFAKCTVDQTYAFLLESAESYGLRSRYSVIGFSPRIKAEFPVGGIKNPLTELEKIVGGLNYIPSAKLPRFQAPLVGYFSYEVARHFEKIKLPTKGAIIPEGIFFLPRFLIIFDHFTSEITLLAYEKKDLAELIETYEIAKGAANPGSMIEKDADDFSPADFIENPTDRPPFEDLVDEAKEEICSGEAFQIVISQLFKSKTNRPPFDLYRRLRRISPSPYMYFLKFPEFNIIGSSPETLVRTEDNEVILRPIAGTRRRGKSFEEDAALEKELLEDAKEQAEHMMLVDLGRNDVARVSEAGTVRVTQLMKAEKFSHVMHLVSEVRGKRKKDATLFDIFKTAFPAGTLTGAPKLRAMEIIARMENHPRDIYGGAVGYFDLSGNMDFAIGIRTMIYREQGKHGEVQMRAGAGIVYDSVPKHEHLECCNKARAAMSTIC